MTAILDEDWKPAMKWLIWSNKHGAWWRPDSRGYTHHIHEAGRFPENEAAAIVDNIGAHGPGGTANVAMVLAPEHRWEAGPPQ